MITGNEIYWITRLDHFHAIGIVFGIIWAIVTACLFIGLLIALDDGDKVSRKWCTQRVIPTLLISMILWGAFAFVPTTKEMCAIKAIPVIVNNKQVQELPNKVVELANEWIDELKPSKVTNVKD